jgi:hypothetical protein
MAFSSRRWQFSTSNAVPVDDGHGVEAGQLRGFEPAVPGEQPVPAALFGVGLDGEGLQDAVLADAAGQVAEVAEVLADIGGVRLDLAEPHGHDLLSEGVRGGARLCGAHRRSLVWSCLRWASAARSAARTLVPW